MLVTIKEMPYGEKYEKVIASIRLLDTIVLPLVKKHQNEQGVEKLKEVWRGGSKEISEDASFEEKYEMAYSNWIWMWGRTFKFVRERLGENAVEEFKRAAVEALKQENSSPVLFLLRVMKALSPEFVFRSIAKTMAYQMQFLGPYSVSELTGRRLVISLPHCKILNYQGGDDACLVGCQTIYPIWMHEQFKVKMMPDRQGESCTLTLTPL